MNNRKFNSLQLYKLTRKIVIVISIIFGILGIIQLYNVFYGAYAYERIGELCSLGNDIGCRPLYMSDRRELEADGWRNIGIAVTLFFLFLSAAWIYKYLFPESKNDERE